MSIKLSKPFISNGKVDEFDVKQIKKALNRLGYYTPYEKVGMTGIPDADVFKALKAFQKDQDLPATGQARLHDATVTALNQETEKEPEGYYVWHTMKDNKVRDSHAALNGTTRAWSDSPDPTQEHNCRCWAELISDSDIEREELPHPKIETPKIPGTNIPDQGIPEQGWPGSRKYDPFRPDRDKNPDPYFDKKPPQSPYMPIYEDLPWISEGEDI